MTHPVNPRADQPPGDAGFSLMEMLIAIAILAVVLAFLPGTFRLAHNTWNATAALDRQASQDGTREFVRARLAEAMPVFERAKSGTMRMQFAGAADTVTFVAPSAHGPQGAGLYRFTLTAGQAGSQGQNALVAVVAPYATSPSSGSASTEGEQHVLYEGVTQVGFRYRGRHTLRAAPAWQERWTRIDALPDAVELTVTTGTRVHVLVVELRLRTTS